MALTAEQQAQLDFLIAQNAANQATEDARRAHEKEMEQIRATNATAQAQAQADAISSASAKQARLEAVRLAQQTLVENSRNKPVSERDITAADITAFADSLIGYINK